MRGVSELFVDLMLTLLVLSVSSAILSYLPTLTQSRGDLGRQGRPIHVYALLTETAVKKLIICNYGDNTVVSDIIINGSPTESIIINPRTFTTVPLSSSITDEELQVLINGTLAVTPEVVEP